jgi:hypothetical protein
MEPRKWRYDYKPGRSREELEEERIIQELKQTPEERLSSFFQLIRLGTILKEATVDYNNRKPAN